MCSSFWMVLPLGSDISDQGGHQLRPALPLPVGPEQPPRRWSAAETILRLYKRHRAHLTYSQTLICIAYHISHQLRLNEGHYSATGHIPHCGFLASHITCPNPTSAMLVPAHALLGSTYWRSSSVFLGSLVLTHPRRLAMR